MLSTPDTGQRFRFLQNRSKCDERGRDTLDATWNEVYAATRPAGTSDVQCVREMARSPREISDG